MALGVERSLPELRHHMEPRGCGRWRTRIPRSIHGSHPGLPREGESLFQGLPAKGSDKDKSGQRKTVTMAPTSKYLTGKSRYVVRKPLVGTDGHISILKKPPLEEHLEKEILPQDSSRKVDPYQDVECQPYSLAQGSAQNCDIRPANAWSLSASGEDLTTSLTTPLTTLDLRSWSPEEPSVVVDFQASRTSHRCLSSPPLDVHGLKVQLGPRWTSTQRSSSLEAYSTSSHFSRRNRAEHRLLQSGDAFLNPRSSLIDGKSRPPALHQMSPHQANYWTCAIPTGLPPSPDRKSPSWDPDKEYEALLDYTYPLRPNQLPVLDSTHPRSLLRTDPLLLDSGIELDCFCSPSNLSFTDQPLGGRRWGLRATEQLNPASKHLSHSKPFDCRLSGSWYSSVDQIGLSVDSLLENDGKQARRSTHQQKRGIFACGDPFPAFIPTSRVLPARGIVWDRDEEYLALPGQLQELQVLSQQLQAISMRVRKPVDTSWESLEKETSSVRSSTTLVENKSREEGLVDEGEEPVSGGPCSPELSTEVEGLEARLQRLGGAVNRSSLREVASFMEGLSGVCLGGVSLSETQSGTPTGQENDEAKESLMQHIQVFCSNLERLIVWLYKVVEKMERLTPPTAEIESVKSSLADYKSFQREVSAQQPLTTAVLHTGEILLRSMDSTSPVLKETLVQIERQSRALETHAEHLFSSILSAMDSLTEPSSSEAEGPITQEQDLNESGFREED